MFQNLSDRLGGALQKLRGQGRITEDNIKDTMREVRMALLEADVALPVVKAFVDQVKEKALGEAVMKSLTPGQALVKIVNDELVTLMGEANEGLNLNAQPPAVVMMAGLQGSGKTTSVGKLARLLKERHNKKVMVDMLLAKNGSVKIDKRFKMFKKGMSESVFDEVQDLAESVENLIESPLKSVRKKADAAGIPYSIAKDVFDRGVAAWRTGHRPGTTPAQWGLARLNSFATGGKTTKTADKDLHDKWKGKKEETEMDEGILKPYHAIGKQPWSKTVKDSKGTAGEYKQIGKGKDFTVWYAYRGSNKQFPHYVVRDDKIIGSGMTVKSALKDAGLKDKDLTQRSKFADGSPLNKGMKESSELTEKLKVSDGLGAWIKDFQDSDAPQFKNADKEKRRNMAIAAFTDAGGKLDESKIKDLNEKAEKFLNERRNKAPKIGVDSLKQIRDKDREHNAAMGKTATGRKKPAARVSSTKKSLADIRKRAK